MALRAQPIALARVAAAGRFHLDLQRMAVAGAAVHRVAARAGRLPAAETAGQRQRLRPIEAARAPVGPEVALRIVGRNRLADEKRQRVVLVPLARLEAEEQVVLVAVAVRARVEDLTRRGALGGKDPLRRSLRSVIAR